MAESSSKTQDSSMDNTQDSSTSAAQSVSTEPVSTKSVATQQASKTSGGKGLSVFAVLLSLIALAGSGFTWYQTQVSKVAANTRLAVGVAEIGGQISRIGDSVSQLQSNQNSLVSKDELSTRLLESNVEADQKLRALSDAQSDITDSVQKLSAELQKDSNDFVIDEVSQLLKLANNSALFSNDAASAIKALTLADIQLKELADPRYAVVRRKINSEINLLKSVERVDVEKVSAKLNTIANTIPSLKLENEPPAKAKVDLLNKEATEGQTISWRSELRKIWYDVINSIQIQRVDQPPKPLLAPAQRYFLDQNLQLLLNKADLALLQGSASIYQQSLASAQQWLNDYFDLKNDNVQAVMTQLDQLKAQPVGVELPAVVDSYDSLQSIKGGQ